MTPDSELLSTYADSRANHAFAEFVERYAALVYRCAFRQLNGDAHAAQDVTQNVFTLVAKKAEHLASHGSVVGWLHTTTRLAARDYLRAAGRRQRYEEAAARFEIHHGGPVLSWERIQPIIDDVLAQLADGDREVVMLRYFAELPFAAIGNRLGIGENAARMRLERALEKLRGHLHTRGIESTGAALALALGGEAAAAVVPAELATNVTTAALSSTAGAIALGSAVGLAAASKIVAGLCAAIIVGSLAIVAYGVCTTSATSQDVTAAEADAAAAEVRAQRLLARAEAEEADLAKLRAAQKAREANDHAVAAVPQSSADSWDAKREGDALLARHPDVRAAFIAWQRSMMLSQFTDLVKELHLTPEQIQRVIDVQLRYFSLTGPWAAGQKTVVLGVGSDRSDDDSLLKILGAEGLKRWNENPRQSSGRRTSAELASALSFSETPLTSAQSSELTSVLSANTKMTPSGLNVDWAAAMDAAKSVLSSVQLEALDRIREKAVAEQKLQYTPPPAKAAANQAKS